MAQPSWLRSYRSLYDLRWTDHPLRRQALPWIIRRELSYLFSTSSLSQMLRAENRYFTVNTLNVVLDQYDFWIRRDVAILSANQVRWYAQSLIQAEDVWGMLWGQKGALGDFLFSAQGIKRNRLRLSCVKDLPFSAQTPRAWYWRRESHWQLEEPPVYFRILEFF